MQVTEDDGVNLSLKISAYEILWCVSDGDSSASERTRDRAFADLKATGAPVVTIAALSTLQKQELSVIISFLSASDTEKTLCGLLTGEAPAAVRAKACAVLAPVMMDVWIATDTFSASNTPPDSYPDLLHRRQDVQDKVQLQNGHTMS